MASTCAKARAVAIAAAAWLATMRSTSTAAGVIGARTNTPSTPSSSPRDRQRQTRRTPRCPRRRTQSGRRIFAIVRGIGDDHRRARGRHGADLERPHGDALEVAVEARARSRFRCAIARGAGDQVQAARLRSAQAGAFAHAAHRSPLSSSHSRASATSSCSASRRVTSGSRSSSDRSCASSSSSSLNASEADGNDCDHSTRTSLNEGSFPQRKFAVDNHELVVAARATVVARPR